MKHRATLQLTAIILILATLACNLPNVAPTLSVDDQAATAIEATLMEGRRNGADVPITATFSPIPSSTSTSDPNAPTATITPTFSTPFLTVLEQTNCRTGPGQGYEVVFTYLPNKKLPILGRYDVENYWLVKSDESPTGQCWLWGEYVEVAGSYWVVPSVTPPPTATLAPPVEASIQKWEFFCSNATSTMQITIKWTDQSNNELGYRVLRNGQVIAELPANSNSYSESITMFAGDNAVYQIEVYNITGSVLSSEISVTC
jgi:hypothetical protein